MATHRTIDHYRSQPRRSSSGCKRDGQTSNKRFINLEKGVTQSERSENRWRCTSQGSRGGHTFPSVTEIIYMKVRGEKKNIKITFIITFNA